MRGVPTGIESFDSITRGMRKTDTWIVAARPGVGKTALMVKMLRGAARSGARTLVYSYEMSPAMLVQRMFTAVSGVPAIKIERGVADEADQRRFAEAGSALTPLAIAFEERGTVDDIRAKATETHRTEGLDLLVIDHIGLVEAIGRNPSRAREVAEVSRGLKSIAKALNIPVLILSQLNRTSDPGTEPSMAELRDSGSLEEDASVIWMLWASEEDEEENLVRCKLAKNRHGRPGYRGVLKFWRDTQRISDHQAQAPVDHPASLMDQLDRAAKKD
jgi:replicative DNA helicase